MAQIDLRNAEIKIKDGSTNSITVSIGEGTLKYSEKRQLDFVKSRGLLDTVRENEEVPLDLSFSFIWEFITAASGEAITVEDALKKKGGAAAWVSASPDPRAPYCVDIEVTYTPPCVAIDKETLLFDEVHWIELAHSLEDGTVAFQGSCNRTQANITRG
jgi:hypothetical protein